MAARKLTVKLFLHIKLEKTMQFNSEKIHTLGRYKQKHTAYYHWGGLLLSGT